MTDSLHDVVAPIDILQHPAVLGARVADAAALGLHWLYDPERIASIATGGDVLFREPDVRHYEECKGYFAHAGRRAGMPSQYGEHLLLVARSIAAGGYSVAGHQAAFVAHFGPGGPYVGYADRPTRALVRLLLQHEEDAPPVSGSDDDQMPVFAVVPPLHAAGASHATLRDAVRVLTTNEEAMLGALALFDALGLFDAGAHGGQVPDVEQRHALLRQIADATAAQGDGVLGGLLADALDIDGYQPEAAAARFGLPCHVRQGLPIVFHLAMHLPDVETVLRDNVRIGGDSCGRAIALGALAGACLGVPAALCDRLAA